MSSSRELVPGKPVGVDNTARKQYDLEEFKARAQKRELDEEEIEGLTPHEIKQLKRRKRDPLHQGVIVKRDHLQGREYDLQLQARLNKTQVISTNMPLNQQAGYYCNVCDCILRDSQSYLDHINGKYHNRALGMNMRVEKKGLDSVKERLAMHRKKKEEEKRDDYVPDGFEKRVNDAEAEEQRLKEEKKAKKKAKKEATPHGSLLDADEAQGLDPEMAAMLGFSGFGKK